MNGDEKYSFFPELKETRDKLSARLAKINRKQAKHITEGAPLWLMEYDEAEASEITDIIDSLNSLIDAMTVAAKFNLIDTYNYERADSE